MSGEDAVPRVRYTDEAADWREYCGLCQNWTQSMVLARGVVTDPIDGRETKLLLCERCRERTS